MKAILLSAVLATTVLTGCQAIQNATHAQTTKTTQSQTERNKANAIAFYEMAFNQHKVKEAVAKYIGKTYAQHNPTVADGGQAFVSAFEPFLQANPAYKTTIKKVVAEGDLVVLHVHSQLNDTDRGQAVMDIFRFDKDGKIVEHWDVSQAVPEKTVSGRTMF